MSPFFFFCENLFADKQEYPFARRKDKENKYS